MVKDKHELIYADPHGGEAPPARSRRPVIALAAGAVAVALMLLAAAVLSITIQGKGERYQAALSLLADKQYADAAAELELLDGFRDSDDLLAQLETQGMAYANALALVEGGCYDEALAAFQSMDDYADSAQWAAWGVTYHRCTQEMAVLGAARQADAQAWTDLAEELSTLGNVADAQALARQCHEMAESLG